MQVVDPVHSTATLANKRYLLQDLNSAPALQLEASLRMRSSFIEKDKASLYSLK